MATAAVRRLPRAAGQMPLVLGRNLAVARAPRADGRMPLLSISILIITFASYLSWRAFTLTSSSPNTKSTFFDIVRPSEEAALRAASFYKTARIIGADIDQKRNIKDTLSKGSKGDILPLSEKVAIAAWYLAALNKQQHQHHVNDDGDNTTAAAAAANDPFIVYHATSWFGQENHKFLPQKMISCPAREEKELPHCMIAAYPSWLRTTLWSTADLVLYHRAEGVEERMTPPPYAARPNPRQRQRHALLAAENFGSLFRSAHTARFDTEISYRQRSFYRDGGYEDIFIQSAGIEWTLLKMNETRDILSNTWTSLGAKPLLNINARFNIGLLSNASSSSSLLSTPSPPSSLMAPNAFRRNATISFASSHCHSRSGREELIAALEEFIPIDVWGNGCLAAPWRHHHSSIIAASTGGDGTGTSGTGSESSIDTESAPYPHQESILSHYKFTLALENADCGDYSTEKALLALARGSVPIILGSSFNAYDFLPSRDSVINIRDFSSVRALVDYLHVVATSDTLYSTFHAWRERPIESYGSALRHALQGILPIAKKTNGYGGAATTWACGLCWALQDDRRNTMSSSSLSSLHNITQQHRQHREEEEGREEAPMTFGPSNPYPPLLGPLPPFSCLPPLQIRNDENGTFEHANKSVQLENWGSGRQRPGPFLLRALLARERERLSLGLSPPLKRSLDIISDTTDIRLTATH